MPRAGGEWPRNGLLQFLCIGSKRPMEVIVAVLVLYVDESSDDKTYLVSGLMAPVRRWDEFCTQWDRILAIEPAVPYWHQSDVWAWPRVAPFDRLSRAQVKEREILLARAVANVRPRAIGTVLRSDVYDAELRGKIKPPRSPYPMGEARRRLIQSVGDSAYLFLHQAWIEQGSRELAQTPGRESARLVIEQSHNPKHDKALEHTLHALLALRRAEGRPDPFHSITHEKGKCPESRPLEAADMHAWALRRQLSGKPHHLCDAILESAPTRCIEFGAEHLRLHVEGLNRPYDPEQFDD